MRFPATLLFALSLFATAGCAAPGAGLFNGRDFAGWEFVAVPAMDIKEACALKPGGVIAVAGKSVGFLATTATHANYRLHAEWRWSDKPGNSGVLVHITGAPANGTAWPLCFQAQLKATRAGDLLPMNGATFAEKLSTAPGAKTPQLDRAADSSEKPAGEWNTCDITCRGDTIEVVVNGVRQNTVTHAAPAAGRVGFQLEGVPFELRQVRLTPLD
ncbi:MAG: DUF1080 domain-containing protein [bacterium]|nr:DUF1080 domain-containing protein [bacterium]MDI1336521.1 DUF1080 domain-containing protein [Lacunisphaera sp.]